MLYLMQNNSVIVENINGDSNSKKEINIGHPYILVGSPNFTAYQAIEYQFENSKNLESNSSNLFSELWVDLLKYNLDCPKNNFSGYKPIVEIKEFVNYTLVLEQKKKEYEQNMLNENLEENENKNSNNDLNTYYIDESVVNKQNSNYNQTENKKSSKNEDYLKKLESEENTSNNQNVKKKDSDSQDKTKSSDSKTSDENEKKNTSKDKVSPDDEKTSSKTSETQENSKKDSENLESDKKTSKSSTNYTDNNAKNTSNNENLLQTPPIKEGYFNDNKDKMLLDDRKPFENKNKKVMLKDENGLISPEEFSAKLKKLNDEKKMVNAIVNVIWKTYEYDSDRKSMLKNMINEFLMDKYNLNSSIASLQKYIPIAPFAKGSQYSNYVLELRGIIIGNSKDKILRIQLNDKVICDNLQIDYTDIQTLENSDKLIYNHPRYYCDMLEVIPEGTFLLDFFTKSKKKITNLKAEIKKLNDKIIIARFKP